MEFRVLGPLQVIGSNDVPIELASASQRRLVSLLLARDAVVSADSLAEHLGVSPGALRTTVSRLRRLLSAGTLASVPPGYELHAETLDARDFEDCLARAGGQAGPRARQLLEEGISMWRGDAYAEFAHEPWALAESRRLAELRTGAVEDLAVLLIESGEWSAAIARLEPLIAAYPFRDRPRGLLMRALADSGRRVDALRVFQDYRRFLLDEVGTEPSPELVALDRDIARQVEPTESLPRAAAHRTNDRTVLFADIVESMDRTSTSPEVVDDFGRHHLSILRQALAVSGGSEVTTASGGFAVVFDRASAALSCAVAMQRGVEHNNRARRHEVGLRVGLSAGRVIAEHDRLSGYPVVEAAHLCRASRSGQILAAASVRDLAGRRSPHRCYSLGRLDLEGVPDPVETVEVLWESVGGPDPDEVPLPVRLGRRADVIVVGRDSELQLVAESAKRVAGGEGREVLLVSGEAGLGKTTLVAEGARVAFTAGACVLFGHCEEDLATPYQLFAGTIGHYVTHCPEDELRAHVEAHGSELARLVPALATRIPDLPPSRGTDPDTERYLLFAAVVGLLSQASEQQPIVLVLDDLQWADAGSLELLRHLIASDQPMAVLVLGTFRDTELSHFHPLLKTLAELQRQVKVARLELTGLDNSAVEALMEAMAGYALDEVGVGLARAVHRETDGNPFFATEVLRHLSETGAIRPDSAGQREVIDGIEDVGLPGSVKEVIGARIGRLGVVAGRMLSTAAVIGRDFDVDLLARAADVPEDELLDLLDTAVAAALVREGRGRAGQYAFAHALIQRSLYEELGPTRRARVHRRVGEALEQLCGTSAGPRVGELAHHWFYGRQPGDQTKALHYSRQAADAALEALAPGEALRYYTQALDLYDEVGDPDSALGIDLRIGVGIAQRQTGDAAFRETLLGASHQAVDLGDTKRLVIAALANNRGWYSAGGVLDADRIEVLEMALDRLSTGDRDRPLVLATLCSELAIGTSLERRRALADEALMLAMASGDDAIILRVLNCIFNALNVPVLLDQAMSRTADALARAERVDDSMARFLALRTRYIAAYVAGDIGEMDRCIAAMGLVAEQLDQPMMHWTVAYAHATQALISGDVELAEGLVFKALQLGTDSGQPDTNVFFGVQLMATNLQKGTLIELVPLIEQMATEITENLYAVKAALVLALADGDRTDEVRQLLEEFVGGGFHFLVDALWSVGMCGFAEGAIEVGEPRFARPLFDQLAPWAHQWCTTGITVQGPIGHYVGGLATVLGRFDEAETYFAQAASMSARARAKFFGARTDLLWGRMLIARHNPDDAGRARALLTQAHAVAVANGYRQVERRAAAALHMLEVR